jgi:hypothetical protein
MSRKCFGFFWPRPNGTADFSRAFQSFRILCERMGRAHGEWARRRLSIAGRRQPHRFGLATKRRKESQKVFVSSCAFLWLPPFDSRRKIHAARLVERARFL